MGYFPNSDAGFYFEEEFCQKCIHFKLPEDGTCAVWMLHLSHNYDQHNAGMFELYKEFEIHGPTIKTLLDELIPRDKQGSQHCAMFVPLKAAVVTGGEAWCESFRHTQSIEDRNGGAPCLLCLADDGVIHAAV